MFRPAAVFTDHCVLQRDTNIRIFGEAAPKTTVSCILVKEENKEKSDSIKKRTAIADKDGHFEIVLDAEKAGGPYILTISDGQKEKICHDVWVGEVWLAGGQSNMELELADCIGGKEEIERAEKMPFERENLRFYYTTKRTFIDEDLLREEERSSWECFGDKNTNTWSAVGYFFMKKLAGDLMKAEGNAVKIGVIGCNWGGTSASCWMDRKSLLEDEKLRIYIDEYDAGVNGKSVEEQVREYDEYEAYHNEWSKRAEACAKEDPEMSWEEIERRCGKCQWPGPMNCKNQYRPCGLYETMVRRITPYTLRGVIWYQAENDDHRPLLYERLFTKLIEVWRRDFKNPELAFCFCQLPMHRYIPDEDFKNWPFIREAQEMVEKKVKHTAMAVFPEYSMIRDIHPLDKKPVGEKLEPLALETVYRKYIPEREYKSLTDGAHSPRYAFFVRNRTKEGEAVMRLYFDHAEDGFECRRMPLKGIGARILHPIEEWDMLKASDCLAKDKEEPLLSDEEKEAALKRYYEIPQGFEIAGEDKVYYPAKAVIGDKVIGGRACIDVSAPEVKDPFYVRYAWKNYQAITLFAKGSGQALSTFRTDQTDGSEGEITGAAAVKQNLEVG